MVGAGAGFPPTLMLSDGKGKFTQSKAPAELAKGSDWSGVVGIDVGGGGRILVAARTGYEAATEQVRETSDRYKLEAVLLRDLLQAQARTTDAQFQYQQALSSYWSAAAELRRAIGDE